MNIISLLFLAFAMSTDAFAAAITKGATLHKPKFTEALRMGAIFGVIEAITPLFGWLLGSIASAYIAEIDHWFAFVLLSALGIHMIKNGLTLEADDCKPRQHSFLLLVITAFATSIDAMVIGVSLAFVAVNIWVASILIGIATFLMVTLGVMLGRVIGCVAGKRSEVLGGIVLIGIGAFILYEHLHVVV